MKDSPHAPTMRDIAKAAGVSAMTVSRALRGSPLQNKDTRRHIERIARELGWRPNPLVSALMSQRVRQHGTRATANLAILDPRSDVPKANRDHIAGCLRRASDLGYHAEVFPYDPDSTSPARLREILLARGVRGVVLMPLPIGVHEITFDFSGFCAATIGYSLITPALPRVANDTQANVHLALRHLEDRGCRRAGLIMADDANRRMLCQYTSAADSYDRFYTRGMSVRQLVLSDETFAPSDMRRILTWIVRHKIEAVISSAEDLYQRLLASGAKIPGDFGYVHLHRTSPGGPKITCVDQMRNLIGQKAADLVTAMIQRNDTFPLKHPQIILTPSELIAGDTMPRIRIHA